MPSSYGIKVLIVDDHPLMREGIARIIQARGPTNIQIVGDAESGEQAIDKVGLLKPDVVLMDIRLPGMDGLQATKLLKTRYPDVEVLIISAYDHYVLEAIRAGASGYLDKSAGLEELCNTINAVTVNKKEGVRSLIVGTSLADETEQVVPHNLTAREMEVLIHLSSGRINAGIAEELGISILTVKKHVQSIMNKLGARDRTQVVVEALKRRIVKPAK